MKIDKTKITRHLRQQQTGAEKRLWNLLRNRQFENLKFRRQHSLKDYIVDFYCNELELVIELDGGYHNDAEQKYKDEQRDFHLRFLGYKVLRFENEVVFNNIHFIYDSIKEIKDLAPSQRERVGVRDVTVLSTKRLTQSQQELLLNAGLGFVEYDAISIEYLDFEMPREIPNAIFTSQNAVRAVFREGVRSTSIDHCFCVGSKTRSLLLENGQKVIKTAKNASELADFITKNHKNDTFSFFCGTKRREELPQALKMAKIEVFEVKTYETDLKPTNFDQKWDGILFFSPSGMESYIEGQKRIESTTETIVPFDAMTFVFCIGETTAAEARKYSDNVLVSNSATVESVIEKAVNTLIKTKC